MRRPSWHAPLLAAAFLIAVGLRLAGITWGLPNTFNSDEPHHINLAVSFGGGSLNPYSFKYPTLWPMLLFISYGFYFLAWSCFGLKAAVGQFASLYVWEPSGFYLIGRGLSVVFSLAAVVMMWVLERRYRGERGENPHGIAWAALALAFSPSLISSAHAAKPDSILLFFAVLAWYFGLKLFWEGARRWYWACGAGLGLALSCQYTAAPAFTLLPLAHLLSRRRGPLSWLAEGFAASAMGFWAGSPYALLDFPKFWSNIRDFSYLAGVADFSQWEISRIVGLNFLNFAGAGSLAGVAAAYGAAALFFSDKRLAALLFLPTAGYAAFLCSHPDGAWMRYLFGCFPAVALLASEGLTRLARGRGPAALLLLALAAAGPGLYHSFKYDQDLLRPDTRIVSEGWITGNIPAGSTLLMDYPHANPRVSMVKEQVQELLKKTTELGSPRSRYFRAMLDSHPGGGYRVYRIQRSAKDLRLNPRLLAMSQADSAMLDLSAGLAAARAARVDYVITSDYGANPARAVELADFFDQLGREGILLKEFSPERGQVNGPLLRVYRLAKARP